MNKHWIHLDSRTIYCRLASPSYSGYTPAGSHSSTRIFSVSQFWLFWHKQHKDDGLSVQVKLRSLAGHSVLSTPKFCRQSLINPTVGASLEDRVLGIEVFPGLEIWDCPWVAESHLDIFLFQDWQHAVCFGLSWQRAINHICKLLKFV